MLSRGGVNLGSWWRIPSNVRVPSKGENRDLQGSNGFPSSLLTHWENCKKNLFEELEKKKKRTGKIHEYTRS